MQANRSLTPFLYVSLFALALAASTGVLLRFGMIYGMPAWALNFAAVRHAHSHLMYFGWVTLALMVFIWRALPGYTGRPLPRCLLAVGCQLGLCAAQLSCLLAEQATASHRFTRSFAVGVNGFYL